MDSKTQKLITVIAISFMLFEVGALIYVSIDYNDMPIEVTLTQIKGGSFNLLVLAGGLGGPMPADNSVDGGYYVCEIPKWLSGMTVEIEIHTTGELVSAWGLLEWDIGSWSGESRFTDDLYNVRDIRTKLSDNVFYIPKTSDFIKLVVFRYTPTLFIGWIDATVSLVEQL